MTKHIPATVDSTYGAPMGRPSHDSFTDRRGRTFQITVTETARPFSLQRVALSSGGYDRGGAYWGLGAPLYWYDSGTGIDGYVRGNSREAAKAAVRAMHPKARFYR